MSNRRCYDTNVENWKQGITFHHYNTCTQIFKSKRKWYDLVLCLIVYRLPSTHFRYCLLYLLKFLFIFSYIMTKNMKLIKGLIKILMSTFVLQFNCVDFFTSLYNYQQNKLLWKRYLVTMSYQYTAYTGSTFSIRFNFIFLILFVVKSK